MAVKKAKKFFEEQEPLNPGDYLAPELEDLIEYLEKDDFVQVIPFYASAMIANCYYGRIVKINEELQYALVKLNSGYKEWFSVEELRLVLKATALEAEAASAA